MKITNKTINYTVDTVDELLTLAGEENSTVIVTDENRGGVFVYRSTNATENNGKTIFNGWTRQEQRLLSQTKQYATKTEVASVAGGTHSSGTAYTLNLPVNIPAGSFGIIELDVSTTTTGNIKILIDGAEIYGDSPNGIVFSTDAILSDGTENNRILSTTKYSFPVYTNTTAKTSVSMESDTTWAGTVSTLKYFSIDTTAVELGVTPDDAIGYNDEVGLKVGSRLRGDIALGNNGALMAFQYDGLSPTPSWNTAIGYNALMANQHGDENTAVGALCLLSNEGSNNTAVGYSALKRNTKGQENTAVGYKAGTANTTGYKNTYLGFWAGTRNSTGKGNVVVGWQNNTAGISKSYTTTVGYNAGSGYNGSNNTFLGAYSGQSISGQEDITVSNATGVGRLSSPLGDYSIAIGVAAQTGTESVLADSAIAIGYSSDAVLLGNIAIGKSAQASGSTQSIAIGQSSVSSGGTGSIAIGESVVSSGSRSMSIGQSSSATGQQCVSVGALADSIADYTTAIGAQSGIGFSGIGNTFLGQFAGNQSVAYTNCTLLGRSATVTGSNQVQLGNASTTTYVYGTVQNRSDKRDKADIRDTELGLDFIMNLRPVDFKWDMRDFYRDIDPETGEVTELEKDGSRKRNRYHQGFIAQEVKETMDNLGLDFGGYQDHSISGGDDKLSIGYDELIAPLVKAVQELTGRIKILEGQLNEQ